MATGTIPVTLKKKNQFLTITKVTNKCLSFNMVTNVAAKGYLIATTKGDKKN